MHPTQILQSLLVSPFSSKEPCIQPPKHFNVLGPFQIGTREVAWGTDPLGRHGGFRNLTVDEEARYLSSIAKGGEVRWSSIISNSIPDTNSANEIPSFIIPISFPDESTVSWYEAQSTYGWAGLQFVAWTRGEVSVCEDMRLRMSVENAVEFWVDGRRFVGDFYGFGTAPVVVDVKRGEVKLEVKVTGDVRATGGGVPPEIAVKVKVERVENSKDGGLVVVKSGWVLPEIVEGRFAGRYAAFVVRNDGDGEVEIVGVEGKGVLWTEEDSRIRVLAGQTRPVRFHLRSEPFMGDSLCLEITFETREGIKDSFSICHEITAVKSILLPHTFTYLHPSGIVSHGIIRPPAPDADCHTPDPPKVSILLSLHGSGVDVREEAFRNAYQSMSKLCAWVVMPNGATPWAGDDWHTWGFGDAQAAVKAIESWIEATTWRGPFPDHNRIVLTGHSNGGQGTWHAGAHQSDKFLAIAPLSGFTSIPNYVPYTFWHPADPAKTSLIDAALSSHRLELLAANLVGTPVLNQHGELDDNVPPFHSRVMRSLLAEEGWEVEYVEVAGKGHWWEGIMTEPPVAEFLEKWLRLDLKRETLPEKWSVLVANPADGSGGGGIVVDQLIDPGKMGRIDVRIFEGRMWMLKTRGVRRFHLDALRQGTPIPERIVVDGSMFDFADIQGCTLLKSLEDWRSVCDDTWKSTERFGPQLGPMECLLRSTAPFAIILPDDPTPFERHLALDIARSLFLYLNADSEIIAAKATHQNVGNRVCVSLIRHNPNCFDIRTRLPIELNENGYKLTTREGALSFSRDEASSVIFLSPAPDGKLAVYIHGFDKEGLLAASNFLPLRTGAGVPDFVILGKKTWRGVADTLALGFFDSEWKVRNWA